MGLWIKAALPRPTPGSWSEDIWTKAAAGILRGFSVGGVWTRAKSAAGNLIHKADIREISLCSVGVNPGTFAETFDVQVGKALGAAQALPELEARFVAEASEALDVIDLRLTSYEATRLATRSARAVR